MKEKIPQGKAAGKSAAVKPAARPAPKPAAKKPAVKAAPAPAPKEAKPRFEVTVAKLKEMAKGLDIKGAYKMDRAELIHAIQVEEGHAACYARIPDCGQMDCLFRPDCLPEMGVII